MDSTALFVTVAGTLFLVLQAGHCLLAKKRLVPIGTLNVLLAATVTMGVLTLFSGRMVVGAELGAVMVQGGWPRWALRAALVSAAIAPTLCWHQIRRLNASKLKAYFSATVLIGLVVGFAALLRVEAFNPGDVEPLRVYRYDVWWPPLVVWLVVCCCGSLLAVLRAESVRLFAALTTALVPPLGSFALHCQDLADPQSRPTWTFLVRAGSGIALLLLVYLFVFDDAKGKPARALQIALTVGAAALSVTIALRDMPPGWRTTLALLPLIALAGAMTAAALQGLIARAGWRGRWRQHHDRFLARLRQAIPIQRVGGFAYSISFPIIAAALIDLFSIGYLNRALEILLLLSAWLLFAEQLAEGTLDQRPSPFKDSARQLLALVNRLWSPLRTALGAIARAAAACFRFLSTGSGVVVVIKTISMLILMFFLIAALDETLNFSPMVIQPFRWIMATEPADARNPAEIQQGRETKGKPKEAQGTRDADGEISRALADGLINALGRLRRDLRTDLTLAQRMPSGEHPTSGLFRAGPDSNILEVTVAKSDDLQVSGVTIPLGFFAKPIQYLVRSLLGVRVVSGTLKKNGSGGGYTIWANASDGESWKESSKPQEPQIPPADPVEHLIEKLAFDVATTDPSFIAAGMTRDWSAFQSFRDGLGHWYSYETRQDLAAPDDLTAAIASFRAAARQDRKFALTFYRLGVALQRAGQPGSAVAAFRDSVAANPGFVRGALEEAVTVYNFNSYYTSAPSVLGTLPPAGPKDDAVRIWIRLIGLPRKGISAAERQASFNGLCDYELETPGATSEGSMRSNLYAAYFFCSRAAALYSHLSAVERESAELRATQASIFSKLGRILEQNRGRRKPFGLSRQAWDCVADPEDLGDGHAGVYAVGSPTSRAALDYYGKSLELLPADRLTRCRAAKATAFLYDDLKPLDDLRHDAGAQSALAYDWNDLGLTAAHPADTTDLPPSEEKKRASLYYRFALDGHEAAIKMEAMELDSLIGYAQTFWQWQLDWQEGRTASPPPPERDMAKRAEEHAREALRLARLNGSLAAEMEAGEALGEVLLGRGRMTEAIEQLKSTVEDAEEKTPRWKGLDETLWDLAQASLCAGSKGDTYLAKLKSREEERESRPFSSAGAAPNRALCPTSGQGAARKP